jgi:hypothetical protein
VKIIQNIENLQIFQNVKMSQFHDLFALTQDRKLEMLTMVKLSSDLITLVTKYNISTVIQIFYCN